MISYEESVTLLRNDPTKQDFVKLCYFDEDVNQAAKRFLYSEEFQEVSSLLLLSKYDYSKTHVLDLGCGNGIASFAFASNGFRVTSVDPDTSNNVGLGAIERLNCELESKIIPVHAFAESLPFQNEKFDIVYARQTLHHFSDLHESIKEVYRVLKPGGKFIATREHVVSNKDQLALFLASHPLHKYHGGENAYPLSTYRDAIKRSGFSNLKVIYPFDSVINYYPKSKIEFSSFLRQKIRNRMKLDFDFFYADFVLKIVQFYLSRTGSSPGRLFSFIGEKLVRS